MKSFEKAVIVKLLRTVEANEEYLTKEENLPQMAKIGYALEVLHKVNAICYGDEGKIKKARCQVKSVRDLLEETIIDTKPSKIYDGWVMHLSERMEFPALDDFKKLIYEGYKLSKTETLLIKPKKTFDEWVDLLTSEEYTYQSIYPNRRKVAAQLLFFQNRQYVYKDGFIEGAISYESLVSDFGDWKNAILPEKTLKQITEILELPMVKEAFEVTYKVIEKRKTEKSESEKSNDKLRELIRENRILLDKAGLLDEFDAMQRKHDEIPTIIFSGESPITQFTEQTHQSYIDAGIEMCKFILDHKANYSKIGYSDENLFLPFCEKFLERFATY
jgi:hypothetical protein